MKRLMDIVGASVGLVVFAPVMAATAAVMTVANRSGPLYKQKRVGKGGKLFTIYKIKTMKPPKDPKATLWRDPARITKPGAVVRKLRLDELPQLVNVLKGDMSLVGPRPLMETNPNAHDKIRSSVRPGMTGVVQVFNDESLPAKKALKMDKSYVRQQKQQGAFKNLKADLKTIGRTPKALFRLF